MENYVQGINEELRQMQTNFVSAAELLDEITGEQSLRSIGIYEADGVHPWVGNI